MSILRYNSVGLRREGFPNHPGDPLASETTKGPVISQNRRDRTTEYVRPAKESSICRLGGGEALPGKGHFVTNAAFADVPDDARIMQEEIFGPVAVSIVRQRLWSAASAYYGL